MKWTPHEQLTQAGAAERHRSGWHGALDQLATSLGNAEVVR